MRNVMLKAWEIARKGQKKFGGKVSEYIAEALRIAWAIVKKGGKKMNKLEFTKAAYKKAREFSKENFDGYVEQMKSKGVQVKYVTADSIDMVAPKGLKATAYVETSNARVVNDDVLEFQSTIYVRLENGKTQLAGVKKVQYDKNDLAAI